MKAVDRLRSDPRMVHAVLAGVLGVLFACSWRQPGPTPWRGPALATLGLALCTSLWVTAASRDVPSPSRRVVRIAAVTRSAALIYWIASWPAPPLLVTLLGAFGIGAIDGAGSRRGERTLAGVAIGGALSVAWNAWRFGAPPQRVFAAAFVAGVGVAIGRRFAVGR